MGRKPDSSNFLKSRAFIAIVISALVLAVGLPFGYIYYNDYMNAPNFVRPEANNISVSAEEAAPGETITYTISLKNEGRRPVHEVMVTTDIPHNTQLVTNEIDFFHSAKEGSISFLIESLEAEQDMDLSFGVEIESPLDNGTVISNNRLDIGYAREGSEEKFEKKFGTSLQTIVKSSTDFSGSYYKITDENSEYIRMGDMLNVVFFIKNSGNMEARNIKISAIIPDNTEYVEGSFTSDAAYMETVGSQPVIQFDSFDAGAETYISYSVEVSTGLADNTRVVFKPVIENGTGQAILENQELTVRAFPQFSEFSLSGLDENGGDLLPDETIKYTVSFKNIGDGSAKNVFVENIIPENTTLLETGVDPSIFNWEAPNRVFSVKVDELSPGEEFSYYYRVKVNGGLYYGTKVTNTSTLIYQEDRLNSESVTHTVISNYAYNVVAMGDSQVANTQWVSHLKNIFEQTYFYGDFNFIKSGKGGETLDMGYNRMLSSGMLGQNPYIFIINYGTNDADTSSGYYRIAPETFRYYLGAMIDTIKTNTGAMVVVMSTGAVNEGSQNSHSNSDLATFNNIAAQVCSQKGAIFVDVFNPMLSSGNPNQYLSDGLHYNSAGDQLVARVAFNAISAHLDQYGTR